MTYEWDSDKATANLVKHGVAFDNAKDFSWDLAVGWIDDRADYGELRRIAVAPLRGRLHVMVFTKRGERIRIISLRKANLREMESHGQAFDR